MPAAVVEAPFDIAEKEVEITRNLLKEIGDQDRRVLWQILELLDRVIPSGDRSRIDDVIALAPWGPVRQAVARIAELRLRRHPPQREPTTSTTDATGSYRHRVTTVNGQAVAPDYWTRAWTWGSFSPDSLAGAADRAYGHHSPVHVLYRHAGTPIGLTRRWRLTEDGNLDVELELFPQRRAQDCGHYIRHGLITGLSVGVRTVHGEWDHLSPREWEPRLDHLDMVRRVDIDIAEISLTPQPAQHDSLIRSYW